MFPIPVYGIVIGIENRFFYLCRLHPFFTKSLASKFKYNPLFIIEKVSQNLASWRIGTLIVGISAFRNSNSAGWH